MVILAAVSSAQPGKQSTGGARRAGIEPSRSLKIHNHVKGPYYTSTFSWQKVPTSAFTFKTPCLYKGQVCQHRKAAHPLSPLCWQPNLHIYLQRANACLEQCLKFVSAGRSASNQERALVGAFFEIVKFDTLQMFAPSSSGPPGITEQPSSGHLLAAQCLIFWKIVLTLN